jgi:hypothetical protein
MQNLVVYVSRSSDEDSQTLISLIKPWCNITGFGEKEYGLSLYDDQMWVNKTFGVKKGESKRITFIQEEK